MGRAAPRQQRGVGVQHGLVSLVFDRAQHLGLGAGGIAEQAQRLVGVHGEHDLVEALARRVEPDRDAAGPAQNVAHGGAKVDAVAKRRDQRLDIATRPAADGAPRGTTAKLQHAVVGEELGEEGGREAPHLIRVRGPHGGGLRDDQALDEVVGVAAVVEEVGAATVPARRVPTSRRRSRLKRVRSNSMRWNLGSSTCPGRANRPRGPARRPLEPAAPVGDREAHVRRLRGDAELGEHALEVRVVALVEDDEPGVDLPAARRRLDADRVRVAARVGAGLEDMDVVAAAMKLGGRDEARDAGADDGDSPFVRGGRHARARSAGALQDRVREALGEPLLGLRADAPESGAKRQVEQPAWPPQPEVGIPGHDAAAVGDGRDRHLVAHLDRRGRGDEHDALAGASALCVS